MRIVNLSKVTIDCRIDNWYVYIQPGSNIECSDSFDTLTFAPNKKSYSIIEAGKSRVLKTVSFFDDPFKLIKEYHLTVNSSFSKESIYDSHQLIITVETCCADIDMRIYYDFVTVECNGRMIKPIEVSILKQAEIQKDFITNNTKLAKWQITWDVIIEPLVLELLGYYAVYRIFSVWFNEKAWSIVFLLLVPNILFEVLVWIFKKGKYKKRADKFQRYFNSNVIRDYCYYD